MNAETVVSIMAGIALAAACGFRVFIPMLVMSIASHFGQLTLASGFEWIGTLPALLAFGIATVIELAGYFIPFVDHLLDLIATPAAVIAGMLAVASTVVVMSPFLHWTLAIIAGGGIAGLVQVFTAVTRFTSTTTTAGTANPLVSTAEAGGSITLSVLAIIVPFVAAGIVLIVLLIALRMLYKKFIQST